eukprot:scaffold11773_cov66-Phaeocystis_antarctica.AAC.3
MGQAEVELAVDAARAAATAKDEGSGLVKAEEEAAAGEINVKEEESFEERIAPLARHITAYILDGTVTAQEKRWRTNMNEQREEVQHRFNDVHTKLDKTTSKLDEAIQLIRNLAHPQPR